MKIINIKNAGAFLLLAATLVASNGYAGVKQPLASEAPSSNASTSSSTGSSTGCTS